LAEVRQLQLLCSEREQSAHATKLQLDAALSCDAEREEQMASALAAAAVLQEERAALQRAREDAVLQSARAAVAAQAAAQQQHSITLSTHDAGPDAVLMKCVACPSSTSCSLPIPLLLQSHCITSAISAVRSGMTLSKYMRGGNSAHPPHDRHCRLIHLLVFGERAVSVRSVSPGLPAAVTASLGARGSNSLGCSFTVVGRDVSAGGLFGGVKEAAQDRVLVFTAAEQQQAKAWLTALRALTGSTENGAE
jgi:hypothetical protein